MKTRRATYRKRTYSKRKYPARKRRTTRKTRSYKRSRRVVKRDTTIGKTQVRQTSTQDSAAKTIVATTANNRWTSHTAYELTPYIDVNLLTTGYKTYFSFFLGSTADVKAACTAFVPAAAAPTYSVVIKNMMSRAYVCNASNFPVVLEVYTLTCRKDISSAEASTPSSILLGSIATDFGYSNDQAQGPTITPYDSPRFVSLFSIDSAKRVILKPGGYREFTMWCKKNQFLKAGSDWNTAEYDGKRAYTRGFMIAARGIPLTVTSSGGNYSTTNYLGRTMLSITYEKYMDMHYSVDANVALATPPIHTAGGTNPALYGINPTTGVRSFENIAGAPGTFYASDYTPVVGVPGTGQYPIVVIGNGSTLKANAVPVQNAPATLT